MARIRTIKPEFWRSESIAALPLRTRLTFIGLWTYVDDNGVGLDNEKLIVAELFPLEDDPRETLASVARDLQHLAEAGRITRYTVAGKHYLSVTGWAEHQKIDRPNRPRYPGPDKAESKSNQVSKNDLRDCRDSSSSDSRNTREGASSGARELGSKGAGEQGSREQEVAGAIGAAPPSLFHTEPSQAGDGENPQDEKPKQVAKTAATWDSYAAAYRTVYGADPVRNRQVNAQLSSFIDRVGATEAPEIAAFYLRHPLAYYRSRGHSVGCLLSDAEKLRTEWATQRVTTSVQARQQERTYSNPAARIAAELAAEEAAQQQEASHHA